MRSNERAKKESKAEETGAVDEKAKDPNLGSDAGALYDQRDEWLLKFEVNEKGVGRLLLPPSLSIFLQSDRVSITPSAGGLFIRSVQ